MPWLERRKRRREAEDWRRENQQRLLDERLGQNTPDDPPSTADDADVAGDAEPADDQQVAGSGDAPDVERTPRPDVPVDLGAVDDQQYTRSVRRAVSRALAEDLGHRGDLTSMTTVPVAARGRAAMVAREAGVVAGLAVIEEVVRQVDGRIEVTLLVQDGARVSVGDVVARLEGPLRTLLTAERTILNLVCQLSGVATHTAAFAAELDGLDCVVRDTRKTTPGLRVLEKRAVQAGGGANHRIGLYDAILVKDNHVAAAGGVAAAARAALDGAPDGVHVQVEVTSLDEAEEALAEGVVDLLLDNFTPDELRVAVEALAGRAAVEASGGITLATARAYAEAGADRLAVGALTHSAPALDLALDVEEVDVAARPVASGATAPAVDDAGTPLDDGGEPAGGEPAGDVGPDDHGPVEDGPHEAGPDEAAFARSADGDEIVVDRAPYDHRPAEHVEVPDVDRAPFDHSGDADEAVDEAAPSQEDVDDTDGDDRSAAGGRFDDPEVWTSDGGWG